VLAVDEYVKIAANEFDSEVQLAVSLTADGVKIAANEFEYEV
jgi:hypothetical protein